MLKLLFVVILILADHVYSQQLGGEQRQPGEISQKKCREYASYAEEKPGCGHKIVKRIVGGKPSGRSEFPHMAIIGFDSPSGGKRKWLCGGSLISEQYILTAAQCLSSKHAGDPKSVLLGVTKLNDSDHRQEINITEKVVHPEYRKHLLYHDIALLKLERPIEVNSYIRPACLYANSKINVETAIATGWGRTEFGTQSTDLLKVTLDIVDYDTCNKTYQVSKNIGIRDDIHICTGKGTEAKDTCAGDAGGPLQIYRADGDNACVYDIIGVTSFGFVDCRSKPSVATRVSYYIKWIEEIVWPENL